MNAPTDIQVIRRFDGAPAFAVIPWDDYVKHYPQEETVPNEVVGYMVKEGLGAMAAWRKHLGLSQAVIAGRMGISQAAYAQQESATKPRKATREKVASAMGIAADLLDI